MNRFRTFVILIVVGAVCVALLALAGWAASIPTRAAILYGPVDESLEPITAWRLAWSLVSDGDGLSLSADPAGQAVDFPIESGETTETIIQRLFDQGLIRNRSVFRDYLIYSGADTRLAPGHYLLSPALNPLQIAATIQNVEASGVKFVILPGWRMEEIAASLPTSGLAVSPEEFLEAARRPPAGRLAPLWPRSATHEGALFPTTYTLPRNLTARGLLSLLTENFIQHLTTELEAGIAAQGLTIYEAVIVASIVEREAVREDEQARIASVFLNRIQAGMPLQADPTVQYALGYDEAWGWWKAPLSLADLETTSAFNTYQVPSLPPAPIANPGLPALTAVAYPEETGYYFFRAACDGSGRHVFAVTFEEHQGNACP